jgi:protein phosphatase
MLICPQCQFENPDNNKFCQQCGTSLTHKACTDCGTQVPYEDRNCPSCGAFTGTVWWAICLATAVPNASLDDANSKSTKVPQLFSRKSQPEVDKNTALATLVDSIATDDPETIAASNLTPPAETNTSQNNSGATSTDSQAKSEVYLDTALRYQLLEPMTPVGDGSTYTVKVLDTQPLQASPLEMLIAAANGENSDPKETDSWQILELEDFALPYFELQEQFYPAIPRVHDAWSNDGEKILLLEDRSTLPDLLSLWRDEQIPQMQLLHMLYDMTSLWSATEQWHCRQSLLELSNLRVDEDQTLMLQRLYSDIPDNPPILQALGGVWHELFQISGRTLLGSVGPLIRDLQSDTIETIDELRSRLEEIATELQADLNPPTADMIPADPESHIEDTQPIPEPPVTIQIYNNEGEDVPTIVLPMQLLSLEDAGSTDVGRQRRHNEDYFGIHTQLTKTENPFGRTLEAKGIYILCDGMGGHAGGEVASALAVKTLLQYFQTYWQDKLPDQDCIRTGILFANQAIYDVNQQDARSGSGRMGTTLVMLLIQDTQVAVAHVGDSRLYRINRSEGLEQLTVDHEVGQREIKRGVEAAIAYSRPDAYQLTQALGPRAEHFVVPDITFFDLDEDTLLLLCSDGLSDNDLIEKHWQTQLKSLISSRNNLEQGVSELIELANQYNGHDNITAVLIRARVRPDLEQAKATNGQ